MKRTVKNVLVSMMACFMLFFALPMMAEAKTVVPKVPSKTTLVYLGNYIVDKSQPIYFSNQSKLAGQKLSIKANSIKSSNSKVVSRYKYAISYNDCPYVTISKPGTATVSFKVKTGGKTYNLKTKVTVVKYTNPVKTLKVGKTNYASKFKKSNGYGLTKKDAKSGKLQIKTKANWKITKIKIIDANTGAAVSAKNNTVVDLNGKWLEITFKNTKTKAVESLTLMNN